MISIAKTDATRGEESNEFFLNHMHISFAYIFRLQNCGWFNVTFRGSQLQTFVNYSDACAIHWLIRLFRKKFTMYTNHCIKFQNPLTNVGLVEYVNFLLSGVLEKTVSWAVAKQGITTECLRYIFDILYVKYQDDPFQIAREANFTKIIYSSLFYNHFVCRC